MKIIVLSVVLCSAVCWSLPYHGQRVKKEVATGSDSGVNLVETSTQISTPSITVVATKDEALASTAAPINENSTAKVETVTKKKDEEHKIEIQARNFPITTALQANEFNGQYYTQATTFPIHTGIHADEFKVRILDFALPSEHTAIKPSEVSIHIPLQQEGINRFQFPGQQIYSSDFGSIQHPFVNQFTSPLYSGSSYYQLPPFTPQSTSYENLFGGISYPIYPILPQEYPVLSGQVLPVLPEYGQGFEFLQPGTIGITDEKVEHESDSVSVEAIGARKINPKDPKIVTASSSDKDPKPNQEDKKSEETKENHSDKME